jgi:hypothetical protein
VILGTGNLTKAAMERIKVNLINQINKIRRGQSTLEYAVLVGCLVGALFLMQIYIKRSLQGRIKEAANEIGEQYSAKASKSSFTQKITQSINITATPNWVEDPVTHKNYEVTEVVRNESSKTDIPGGSYEETGVLSAESLF